MNSADAHSSNKQEQMIDATLTALRQAAQPPDGLEQRTLQSLSERTAETPRNRWRVVWLAVPVTVCTALATLSIYTLRQTQRAPSPMANNTPVSTDSASVRNPQLVEQLPTHETTSTPYRQARAHRTAVAHELRVVATDGDTPPPPAPLTEQERLLLQIAVSGDPGQRAMLNPEILARKESEEDAEFRNFFAKPTNVQTRNP
jgi:hypothetical protein